MKLWFFQEEASIHQILFLQMINFKLECVQFVTKNAEKLLTGLCP